MSVILIQITQNFRQYHMLFRNGISRFPQCKVFFSREIHWVKTEQTIWLSFFPFSNQCFLMLPVNSKSRYNSCSEQQTNRHNAFSSDLPHTCIWLYWELQTQRNRSLRRDLYIHLVLAVPMASVQRLLCPRSQFPMPKRLFYIIMSCVELLYHV